MTAVCSLLFVCEVWTNRHQPLSKGMNQQYETSPQEHKSGMHYIAVTATKLQDSVTGIVNLIGGTVNMA